MRLRYRLRLLSICDAPLCANGATSTEPDITFDYNFFKSFSIDGTPATGNSMSVSELGNYLDGAAKTTFDGTFATNANFVTGRTETVFFREHTGGFSDVLYYDETLKSAGVGEISGYVISDAENSFRIKQLHNLGIFATAIGNEKNNSYAFGNARFNGYFQSEVPEPATWVMLALGFVGLGYAGFRGQRKGAISIS